MAAKFPREYTARHEGGNATTDFLLRHLENAASDCKPIQMDVWFIVRDVNRRRGLDDRRTLSLRIHH